MDTKKCCIEGEENELVPEGAPVVEGVEFVELMPCLVGVDGVVFTELNKADRNLLTLVGVGKD